MPAWQALAKEIWNFQESRGKIGAIMGKGIDPRAAGLTGCLWPQSNGRCPRQGVAPDNFGKLGTAGKQTPISLEEGQSTHRWKCVVTEETKKGGLSFGGDPSRWPWMAACVWPGPLRVRRWGALGSQAPPSVMESEEPRLLALMSKE